MIRILANDGIHPDGQKLLEDAGCEVITTRIDQDKLSSELNNFDGILVRSATTVRQDLIDACPNLKVIGRGGVGLDNIDVDYAKAKGIAVFNTPAASSRSVAELVFGHIFSLSRFIHLSDRQMPSQGAENFKGLKKNYAKGIELKGKTVGIIGLGRIGQEVAKIAFGLGMKVIGIDPYVEKPSVTLEIGGQSITVSIPQVTKEELLAQSDYISIHVPMLDQPVISSADMAKLKSGAILINASRGGMIDEDAMIAAVNDGTVGGFGLDVFRNEPTPASNLLNHDKISVTPHIGASTAQAQANIGIELAEKIIDYLKLG